MHNPNASLTSDLYSSKHFPCFNFVDFASPWWPPAKHSNLHRMGLVPHTKTPPTTPTAPQIRRLNDRDAAWILQTVPLKPLAALCL